MIVYVVYESYNKLEFGPIDDVYSSMEAAKKHLCFADYLEEETNGCFLYVNRADGVLADRWYRVCKMKVTDKGLYFE